MYVQYDLQVDYFEVPIGHCRNVGQLGKSLVVFGLLEKLR